MKINLKSTYVKWGITAFAVLCATILFFFLIFWLEGVAATMSRVIEILMPFVYGLVVAYLLCPVYNFCTRNIYQKIHHKMTQQHALSISRMLSTTITMLLAFLAVGGLLSLVIPQIVDSLINLVRTSPESFTNILDWCESQLSSNKEINSTLRILMGDYTAKMTDWSQNVALPWLLEFAAQLSTGVVGVFRFFWDFIIGIIICIYFLNSKELFKAQAKKLVCAFFEVETAVQIIKEAKFINKTFGAFISGKIIDSAIIGVICFVVCTLLEFPYVMLISVIIGVTNIIPFFGPFIGAIPSTIIVLTANPVQAVYFVIFIIILQQIDGNIIGPKILGESTGIPSFWVMFAILVGGGMFGFVGMILGIPIFAILYTYMSRWVDNRLKNKNMPVSTNIYKNLSDYGETGRDWLDAGDE